jgi:hypothetical protein
VVKRICWFERRASAADAVYFTAPRRGEDFGLAKIRISPAGRASTTKGPQHLFSCGVGLNSLVVAENR